MTITNLAARQHHARRTGAATLTLSALLLASVSACGGGSDDSTLTLSGALATQSTPSTAVIRTQAATTQTDTFTAAGVSQTHIYTGTSLWGLLNNAGLQLNAAVKNDVLNHLVLATGSDGYRVVYSLGEIDPDFGNQAALVAYDETINGVLSPLGSDGPLRTTAPWDGKGGRYVSNLAKLDVRASGSLVASTGGGASTSFTVSGAVLRPGTYNLASLQALPAVTVTAGTTTYTGVSLWALLNTTSGLATNPAVKNDSLGMYAVATGSDGYKAVYSLGELDPGFGNQPDIVAYASAGAPLTTSSGFARIVVPKDVKAGRYVSNLISIEVFSAAP